MNAYIKIFNLYLNFLEICSKIIYLCGQSLSILLTPEQLMRLNFLRYKKKHIFWKEPQMVNRGLRYEEEQVIKEYLDYRGRALILFCGGGREIIYFLKNGYNIVGVDYLPPSMELIQQYFKEDISPRVKIIKCFLPDLILDEKNFDLIVTLSFDFCSILGKENRVKLLKKSYSLLKEGSYFIFNIFIDDRKIYFYRLSERIFKKDCERFYSGIFCHFYRTEAELKAEVNEAYFSECLIHKIPNSQRPERIVILKK